MLNWSFFIAGVAAACGPVVIHLLNRQRYRQIDWAAMDFLREAIQRSRRVLQLRDLLLLAVRTLCLLLFGLAMARPYLSKAGGVAGPGEPVHAVAVIDNSLSMGYQRLDGTLLDEAKSKVRAWVEQLPTGSRISVLPLCRQPAEFSWDPYRTRQDALEALDAIELVDRQGSATEALDLACEACRRTQDPATKRIIFVGDQQAINWPTDLAQGALADLPDLQIVQVAAEKPENAWVADVRVPDGLADVETPTPLVATIRYEGTAPRSQVEVTLSIDRVPVDAKTIDLEPGQAREVSFLHQFETTAEPGRAAWVAAAVSLPADRLAEDDARHLVVPVVAGVPVVFVDQLGDDEDPARGRFGETYRLRRLLTSAGARSETGKQLVRVRHVRIDEVDRELLADARLVVIAGVDAPGSVVPLLREYVEQGGPLVIAAGGSFEPAAWNTAAWLDGRGILPAPLKSEFIGQRPSDAATGTLEPFGLDPVSLLHPYFRIDELGEQELADLYREPLFFQAVAVDANEAGESKAEAVNNRTSQATWLTWATPALEEEDRETPAAQLAERLRAQVLARFTNRAPFVVERRIGRGAVLFVASAVHSDWNTLTTTNAVLIFDRMMRSLIEETLPRRNFAIDDALRLPIDARQRRLRLTLVSPTGPDEPLTVDAIGGEAYAVALPTLAERGVYRITGQRADQAVTDEAPVLEIPLAINGPEGESHLQTLDAAQLAQRFGASAPRFVSADEELTVEGTQFAGKQLWTVLMASVLAGLLLELSLLAWPRLRERAA